MSSRRALAVLLMAVVVLSASVSTARLGEDGRLGQRSVLITVEQPNSTQNAIERDIVIPLEDQLSGLRGAQEIEALVQPGRAQVQVRFSGGTRMDEAYLDLRESVERAATGFPPTARRPVINRADIDARPLFAAAFDTTKWNEAEIRRLFERIEGVARIEVSGAQSGDIEIVYHPSALPDDVSSAATLVSAVRERQVAIGTSKNGIRDTVSGEKASVTLPLVLDTRAESPQDLERTWVSRTLRLGDVAEARLATGTSSTLALVDGRPRAVAYVYHSSDAGAIEVSRRLRRESSVHAGMVVLLDRGAESERRLREAAISIAAGLISICALTYLFDRSLRLTLVAAGALAVSALAAGAVLSAFDHEVTVLTLAALAISAGLGIDSVVVLSDALRRHGGDAVRARRQAAAPVILSTLTTVVVFVPLLFAPAPEAERYGAPALTIIASLATAAVYVLVLAPHLAGTEEHAVHRKKRRSTTNREALLLQRVVVFSFCHRRWLFVATAIAVVAASVASIHVSRADGALRGKQHELEFSLVFEPGTVVSVVAERSRAVEEAALSNQGVRRVIVDYRDGRGRFMLHLHPNSDASAVRSAIETAAHSGEHGELFFSDDLDSRNVRSFPVLIRGPQLQTTQVIALRLANAYQQLEDVDRVILHFREGPPAHLLQLDLPRLEQLRVDPASVVAELRWAVGSQVVVKRPGRDREHDIFLVPRVDRGDNVNSLLSAPMFGAHNNLSAFDLGALFAEPTSSTISRVNRARSARLTVLSYRRNRAMQQVQTVTRALPLPEGYAVDIAPGAQDEAAARRLQLGAVVMATLLVGAVLLCFRQQVAESALMLTQIPVVLAIPVLALAALGIPMSATVILGLILSAGVSVNNCIVVLDERDRAAGTSVGRGTTSGVSLLSVAILAAARPITLATVTTLAGVAPLLFAIGNQTMVSVLSLTLAFGILGSFVTTFTLLPALYLSLSLPWVSRTRLRRWRRSPSATLSASSR